MNVIGALAMGIILTASGSMHANPVLTTGLLGGFTTFSAASLESARDFQSGRWLRGILIPLAMMLSCVIAIWVGLVGGWIVLQFIT